jgi:hypothetical protein
MWRAASGYTLGFGADGVGVLGPGEGRGKALAAHRAGPPELQAVVRRITGELAALAERAAAEGEHLLVNARRALRNARGQATGLAATGARDRQAAGVAGACGAR